MLEYNNLYDLNYDKNPYHFPGGVGVKMRIIWIDLAHAPGTTLKWPSHKNVKQFLVRE